MLVIRSERNESIHLFCRLGGSNQCVQSSAIPGLLVLVFHPVNAGSYVNYCLNPNMVVFSKCPSLGREVIDRNPGSTIMSPFFFFKPFGLRIIVELFPEMRFHSYNPNVAHYTMLDFSMCSKKFVFTFVTYIFIKNRHCLAAISPPSPVCSSVLNSLISPINCITFYIFFLLAAL